MPQRHNLLGSQVPESQELKYYDHPWVLLPCSSWWEGEHWGLVVSAWGDPPTLRWHRRLPHIVFCVKIAPAVVQQDGLQQTQSNLDLCAHRGKHGKGPRAHAHDPECESRRDQGANRKHWRGQTGRKDTRTCTRVRRQGRRGPGLPGHDGLRGAGGFWSQGQELSTSPPEAWPALHSADRPGVTHCVFIFSEWLLLNRFLPDPLCRKWGGPDSAQDQVGETDTQLNSNLR